MKKRTLIGTALCLCLAVLAGCGGRDLGTVSVESVSDITGIGSGLAERYAGIVAAGDTLNIERDSDKKIDELLVEAGDEVRAGQVLFTYDTAQMELDLQKAKLELEQLQNSIVTMTAQKADLEEQREWAWESQQLEYTIQIQELETNIREAEYNVKAKEVDIQRLESSMDVTQVASPVNGTVQSVNPEGVDSQGNAAPYIVITESGAMRVKGLVNELNAGSMIEGMQVIIRSRFDESQTWRGVISGIQWDKPESGSDQGMYYMDSGEMTSVTRYPFYVELESSDGLLLGQHVFIEPDLGQTDRTGLYLPEFYICDPLSSPYVWAESGRGTLEKRRITLGNYDEESMCYEVTDGLDASDYIAFPSEDIVAGMTCVHYGEGEDIENGTFTGGDDYYPADGAYDDGFYEGSGNSGMTEGTYDGEDLFVGGEDAG